VPDLPYVEVTNDTEVAAGGLSDSSVYGYRIAWVMEDGSFGPPSAPIFFSLGANTGGNTGWSVDFQYIAHPSSDNPTDSTYWGAKIRGLAIFMTEAIAQRTITSGGDVSHFFGESYFLIHVADRPSELSYS